MFLSIFLHHFWTRDEQYTSLRSSWFRSMSSSGIRCTRETQELYREPSMLASSIQLWCFCTIMKEQADTVQLTICDIDGLILDEAHRNSALHRPPTPKLTTAWGELRKRLPGMRVLGWTQYTDFLSQGTDTHWPCQFYLWLIWREMDGTILVPLGAEV